MKIEKLLEKAADEYNSEHKAVITSKKKLTELYTDIAECVMLFLGFQLSVSWEDFLVLLVNDCLIITNILIGIRRQRRSSKGKDEENRY